MFREYTEVEIVRELEGGHSGARVLLVRPIRVGGHRDAPVVAKLDERQSILYERRRYDLHVKGTLPATTARLLDAPAAPDKSWCAGLKYTFVGRLDDTEPVSLRELALRDPQKLGGLIHTLFDEFGPSWWLQRHPYRFGVWREYEHVLPPSLVVEALPDGELGATGHELAPLGAWSRDNEVLPGEIVALNGFAVQKLDVAKDILYLAAGAQPEAINRASKVEVRGLGLNQQTLFRGETIDRVVGRVVSTRDDLLRRSLQALEPNFDLRAGLIPSGQDGVPDLPNPLFAITALLERQVNGYLSVIHGDLHLGNVLVGPRGDAWLIDFAWTREGHTLFDWAMLEASLLVEVVARLAPPGWEGAWGIVKMLHQLYRGEDRVLQERHHAGLALHAVKAVHDIVRASLMASEHWTEYYVALSLLALRLMDWKSESLDARRLAFLLSALALSLVRSTPHDTQSRSDQSWLEVPTDIDLRGQGPGQGPTPSA
ncbi:MAG: hypothetical protein EHM39_04335 [Chloroflexi bacterium]|nr:MAG: hypothetical protein EHM39_04335 [Chloroflexota bacterium]